MCCTEYCPGTGTKEIVTLCGLGVDVGTTAFKNSLAL